MTLAETTALIAKARRYVIDNPDAVKRGSLDLVEQLADALQSSLVPMGTVGPQPPPSDKEGVS